MGRARPEAMIYFEKLMLATYLYLPAEHEPQALDKGASKFIDVVEVKVSYSWHNTISHCQDCVFTQPGLKQT